MVLDTHRDRADPYLMPVARKMINVDPNLISLLALVLSVIAGAVVVLSPDHWQLMLPLITVLVLASGYFDALDGKVARLTGKSSKRGDLIDHVFDRYADIFMIGAVAVSAWCNVYLGVLALLGVLMTSYMGTQAQALGIGRMYAGLLGRADRMVLMLVVPMVQWLMMLLFDTSIIQIDFISLTWFEIMMLWFAVIGNLTAIQRGWSTWKALK
ncbi:MAG TPA: CDP-alcohol phosphatidyltransferase family protein [Methanomassiliicoccales archaeon]|nr:CDP-alcohol phosphatidyltransferase family protein [Methanomassiliicoccales archaeon]